MNVTIQKQKQKQLYEIVVLHSRPGFPENCTFMFPAYYAKSDSKEEVEKVFRFAFQKAHPTFTIKKVVVTPA